MASNCPTQEAIIHEGGSSEHSAEDQIKVKHRFSEPWEDSDVIVVVEDEKFHVHRLILSMNSPVFKAMFKSQFKEVTSNEIPLPGKKANEVLDLLKCIYFQHLIQEPVEITMLNVEHLLKLSDEYQVKHFFDSCISFVENQPILKENVMTLRKIATIYNLNSVLEGCEDVLKNMKLKTLSEVVDFKDLDRETLQHFLEQRIERLEKFFDQVYPEYMGMVEYVIDNFKNIITSEHYVRIMCSEHINYGKLRGSRTIDSEQIRKCIKCQTMISTLFSALSSYQEKYRCESHQGKNSSLTRDDSSSSIDGFYKLKHGN